MKLLILGHARHGKDTVAEIIHNLYGLKYESSSHYAAEKLMMPAFTLLGKHYDSVEECFADRVNHRKFWFDIIRNYTLENPSKLVREIYARNDVYVGLRSKAEFHSCKNSGAFDFAIWVDASDRCPPEEKNSCDLEPWMCDFVIDNNGSEKQLKRNVVELMEHLRKITQCLR